MPLVLLSDERLGRRWAVSGAWGPSDARQMAASDVRRLEVSGSSGFQGRDLDFLADIDVLDWLFVNDFGSNLSVDGINRLGGLRSLWLNRDFAEDIDLAAIPGLVELHTEWGPGAETISRMTDLRRLSVHHAPYADLTWIGGLTRLECLRIGNSARLISLHGIKGLQVLQKVSLIDLRSLSSLDGIESVARLRFLDVRACRALRTIDPVRACAGLEALWLLDCGAIESLIPVEGLRNLRTLLFYGSTKILDGDLEPLTRLPRLADVAFGSRRSYSHSLAEVETLIASRPKLDALRTICSDLG